MLRRRSVLCHAILCRGMLAQKAKQGLEGRILVIVPTVHLTVQHAGMFIRAGFPNKGWEVRREAGWDEGWERRKGWDVSGEADAIDTCLPAAA